MQVQDTETKTLGTLIQSGPSRSMQRAHALLWLIGYLAIFYVFRDYLPEKYGRDAGLLADVIEIGKVADGSFSAMAAIYGALPEWFLPHLPALVGGVSLWVVLSYVRSYPTMLLLLILLPPYLLLNFLYPIKETLVGVMALAIHFFCRRKQDTLSVFLFVLAIYVPYGIFVRQYYLLIVAAFIGIFIMSRTKPIVWIAMVFAGIMALFLVPEHVFFQIQSPRDEIYAFAMSNANPYIVRTGFPNPLPPINAFNFLVNTAYSLLILFIPFIIGQTVSEVLMLINVAAYTAMVCFGLKYSRKGHQLPYLLFIAHILVQAQFEPDLGSYVRHFSSVLVMIAPALQFFWMPRGQKQTVLREKAVLV